MAAQIRCLELFVLELRNQGVRVELQPAGLSPKFTRTEKTPLDEDDLEIGNTALYILKESIES